MNFASSIITCTILTERWIVEKEENADEPWVRESLSDLETLFSPRQTCPKKFLSHSYLVLVLKRRTFKKKFFHFWSAPLGPQAVSGPNQNKSSRALSLFVTELNLEKKTNTQWISKTYVTLNNFPQLCGQQRALFEIFGERAGSLCLSSLTGLLCKWEKRGDCRVSDYWPTFCLPNFLYKYRRLSKTLNFEIFANTLNKTGIVWLWLLKIPTQWKLSWLLNICNVFL